jgi:hypothetical protein
VFFSLYARSGALKKNNQNKSNRQNSVILPSVHPSAEDSCVCSEELLNINNCDCDSGVLK